MGVFHSIHTFRAQETQPIAEAFFRDGCVLIPGVLTAEEVTALRAKTDEYAIFPRHGSCRVNCFVGPHL